MQGGWAKAPDRAGTVVSLWPDEFLSQLLFLTNLQFSCWHARRLDERVGNKTVNLTRLQDYDF